MLSWLRARSVFSPLGVGRHQFVLFYAGERFASAKQRSEPANPLDKLEQQRALHPKKRKKYGAVGRGERRREKIERRQALREERRLYRAEKRYEAEADEYRRSVLLNKYKCLIEPPVNFPSAFSLDPTRLASWHHLSKTRRRQALQLVRLKNRAADTDDEEEDRAVDDDDGAEHIVGDEEERLDDGQAAEDDDDQAFTGPGSEPIGGKSDSKLAGPKREFFSDISLELDSKQVFLIDPCLSDDGVSLPRALRDVVFAETCKLVEAVGWTLTRSEQIVLRRVHPKWFFGAGKAGELAGVVDQLLPQSPLPLVVVVNGLLSGGVLNRLEKKFGGAAAVLDRMGLILEIFKRRARHRESKLLVELAALQYERSRLVGAREGLDRQRGGGRSMAGSGETKFETDRRALDTRIDWLNKQLSGIERRRSAQRVERKRKYPVVALVGYTNVGKTALLNRLTGAEAFSEDVLFASLDTFTRPMHFASGQTAVVVDTIGFISNLPDSLLPAFRATLEELRHADLIVHVRDAANPYHDWQAQQVEDLLASLDIHTVPTIDVYNKIDDWTVWQQQAQSRLVEREAADVASPPPIVDATAIDWDADQETTANKSWNGDEQTTADKGWDDGEETTADKGWDDDGWGSWDDDDDDSNAEEDSVVAQSNKADGGGGGGGGGGGNDSDADWDNWDPDEGVDLSLFRPAFKPPDNVAPPELNHDFIRISAHTGEGCAQLRAAIEQRLEDAFLYTSCDVAVSVFHPQLLSFCHRNGKVRHKEYDHDADTWKLRVLFLPGVFAKYNKLVAQQQYADRLHQQLTNKTTF